MLLLDNKNSILEALRLHPDQARRIWIEAGYESQAEEIVREAKRHGISFRVVSRDEFSKRFRGTRFRVCLERESFSYRDPDALLRDIASVSGPFLAAFDGISDPQNLGNIMRTAGCLRTETLILPKDRCCGVTETVVKVAHGAAEHVAVAQVTNLHRYLEALKQKNIFCFGLDERGDKYLWELDLTIPLCLVFGNEEGMRRLTRETCDEIARIPTAAGFPTLNVATSFAICAYEVVRQRRKS